jgi:hypothetical protein
MCAEAQSLFEGILLLNVITILSNDLTLLARCFASREIATLFACMKSGPCPLFAVEVRWSGCSRGPAPAVAAGLGRREHRAPLEPSSCDRRFECRSRAHAAGGFRRPAFRKHPRSDRCGSLPAAAFPGWNGRVRSRPVGRMRRSSDWSPVRVSSAGPTWMQNLKFRAKAKRPANAGRRRGVCRLSCAASRAPCETLRPSACDGWLSSKTVSCGLCGPSPHSYGLVPSSDCGSAGSVRSRPLR